MSGIRSSDGVLFDMPVRKSFASQKLMGCSEVPVELQLEAARYLLAWADSNRRPSLVYSTSAFIFQHSTDQDERLSRAQYLIGERSPLYVVESTQLDVAKWVLQNLEEGTVDYDLACIFIVRLDPTSQLAGQAGQYLYRTAFADPVEEEVQDDPSLPAEPSEESSNLLERVSRYEREPVI